MIRQKIGAVVENIPVCGPALREAVRNLKRWREGRKLSKRTREDIFSDYYKNNKWGDAQSRSGQGSSLESTAALRHHLPVLWRELGVRSIVDAPCGDFAWMSHVDLSGFAYIGIDIVEDVITANKAKYGSRGISFQHLDLISGKLPRGDLVFCRDCLVHFSFADIERALTNIRQSGAQWLMTTHFPKTGRNTEIVTGQWRPIDLERPPFCFPPPRSVILESSDASAALNWPDKSLAVWAVADIPERLSFAR
jgi:hypothetical protein